MSGQTGTLVVLGVGNVLLRDEGVGVRVVREIGELVDRGLVDLPADTSLLDGGTCGLALLPLVSDARAVVVVDACDAGLAPGAVRVFHGDELAATGRAAGAGVGPADLLAMARLMGMRPGTVSLVGIQAGAIDIGTDLTEVVQRALPAAVATTLDEVRRLDGVAPAGGRVIRGQEEAEALA
jgi:hydrogenase maturation protease